MPLALSRRWLAAALALTLAGCATVQPPPASAVGRVREIARADQPRLRAALAEIAQRNGLRTVGVGVLRGGRLVYADYWGEEAPGAPASADTRFNVASITKTVTAETILRLVGRRALDLDESMAPWWIDPQLRDDPRAKALTPRIALSHTTGLPNWRFFRKDGRLAFERDPGTAYGYSGEGIEYLARYAEKKLGKPFPALVEEEVFRPLGMTASRLTVDPAAPHLARPADEAGTLYAPYARPGGWRRPTGSWSAADDLATTVPDYARFLAAVARRDGYGPALAADRDRIQSRKGAEAVVACAADAPAPCPRDQGYGLGFDIVAYDNTTMIGHTGGDWAEVTVGYIYAPSQDGIVLFINAPSRRALEAMPDLLALFDPASPYLSHFSVWRARTRAEEKP